MAPLGMSLFLSKLNVYHCAICLKAIGPIKVCALPMGIADEQSVHYYYFSVVFILSFLFLRYFCPKNWKTFTKIIWFHKIYHIAEKGGGVSGIIFLDASYYVSYLFRLKTVVLTRSIFSAWINLYGLTNLRLPTETIIFDIQ